MIFLQVRLKNVVSRAVLIFGQRMSAADGCFLMQVKLTAIGSLAGNDSINASSSTAF
jgi:hypothetical protein